ncbi:unnamed protein product [Coccothraustes coccothraustes]
MEIAGWIGIGMGIAAKQRSATEPARGSLSPSSRSATAGKETPPFPATAQGNWCGDWQSTDVPFPWCSGWMMLRCGAEKRRCGRWAGCSGARRAAAPLYASPETGPCN